VSPRRNTGGFLFDQDSVVESSPGNVVWQESSLNVVPLVLHYLLKVL
jgi:hypothetical protein